MKSKAPVIITIVIVAAVLVIVLIVTNVFGLLNKPRDAKETVITYAEIHDRVGVGLKTWETNTLEVGDICYFIDEETASIPSRWAFDISDEHVMGLFSDESWSDNNPDAAPGGLKGWRLIHFEALAPGECTIMIQYKPINNNEEEPFSEEYANVYSIVVADSK